VCVCVYNLGVIERFLEGPFVEGEGLVEGTEPVGGHVLMGDCGEGVLAVGDLCVCV
jgi:hypothetical protein